LKAFPCTPDDAHVDLTGNQLLALLSEEDVGRWRPQLESVELALGQVLSESGSPPAFVYFPTTAIVSLLYTTAEGNCSEIAVVGRDGLVGISVFMGGNATPSQAVVQSAGQAWRLPARLVREESTSSPLVLQVMLGYTRAMLAQVAQTAACNRYHSIDQLLCRRLLLGLDRSNSASLVMTQELAANLLGVRREGVTGAALKLQQAGVISYSRGHISVLDRSQLEARTRCAWGVSDAVGRSPAPRRALMPQQVAALV
jgi:CRP-like cAMP-binding protein